MTHFVASTRKQTDEKKKKASDVIVTTAADLTWTQFLIAFVGTTYFFEASLGRHQPIEKV